MTGKVRTRYAPSPTGFMHVGNLRTALYEYLIAKSQGGTFVLRIEDTDRERYVEGAVDVIYNTLAKAGLKHDEGPDIGGDYGPYVQSERRDMYRPFAERPACRIFYSRRKRRLYRRRRAFRSFSCRGSGSRCLCCPPAGRILMGKTFLLYPPVFSL